MQIRINLKSTHPADRKLVAVKGSIFHFRIFYVAVRTGPSKGGSYQGYDVKIPRGPAGSLGQQWHAQTSCDVRDSLDRHHGCDRGPFQPG